MPPSTALSIRQAHALLRTRFGYTDFRPGQAAIIDALLQGGNVLAVMPTGSGKSLCYQLPALLREGCTVVISPLIALMKDQVDALQVQGIAATFINSSLSAAEQQARLRDCRAGAYALLYVAPERFRNPRFLHAIEQMRVSLFAVDEAHCISAWGHDFRPDYLRLRQAIERLQQPQVLALTATATVEVQQDIMRQLGCNDMQPFVSGFDRPNLVYRVAMLNSPVAKLRALDGILAAQESGSTIIYAATRRAVEEVASSLQAHGADVLIYHAGLPDAERQRMQEAFMAQQQGLIVATNAFGMGVDKPDVRCVVHFNLPRSMEAYYQEAGRAGRDGLPAQCVLFFSYGDVRIQEFLLEQSYPPRALLEEVYGLIAALSHQRSEVPVQTLLPRCRHSNSETQVATSIRFLEKAGYVERLSSYEGTDVSTANGRHALVRLATEARLPHQLVLDDAGLQHRKHHELRKLRHMIGYANTRHCRRQRILGYFGETWSKENCAACDRCLRQETGGSLVTRPTRTLSEAEWLTIQKILSCIARMRGRYGKARVVQVLMGSRAKEIRQTHLVRLSTYGILKGTSRPLIEAYIDALLDADCVEIVGDEFPKLELTTLGQAVMRRQQSIQLALPGTAPRAPSPMSSPPAAPATATAAPCLTPEVVVPDASLDAPDPSSDAALLERLRAQRTALARVASLPPYCIFNDRTLREMAVRLPVDRAGLLQIHGVGNVKAAKYGEVFLEVIRDCLGPQ